MRRRTIGLVGVVGVAVGLACGKSCGGSTGADSTNGTTPSLTPMKCHAACASRAQDGSAALKSGDYASAFEAYRCGDTAEASFGAGVTALLTAIEGASAKAVFTD